MAKAKTETSKIVFSDGRRGKQTVWIKEDGSRVLTGIVVTREANGNRCRIVYAERSFIQDNVFGFSDLGNVTWEIVS